MCYYILYMLYTPKHSVIFLNNLVCLKRKKEKCKHLYLPTNLSLFIVFIPSFGFEFQSGIISFQLEGLLYKSSLISIPPGSVYLRITFIFSSEGQYGG